MSNKQIEKALLDIAKELIEMKFRVDITSIEYEDGSGRKFIITTKLNPGKKQFVAL